MFEGVIRLQDRPNLNPAEIDQEMDRMRLAISELARVSRGAAPVVMPDIPQPLTEQRVRDIVAEMLAGLPKPAPAAAVDLSPLESRLQSLQTQVQSLSQAQSTPPAVDFAPILDQIKHLEQGLMSTRMLLYRYIVFNRRLREGLSSHEDRGDRAAMVQNADGTTSPKYPMLVGSNTAMTAAEIQRIGDQAWQNEILWARKAATMPATTPQEVEDAISLFFGDH